MSAATLERVLAGRMSDGCRGRRPSKAPVNWQTRRRRAKTITSASSSNQDLQWTEVISPEQLFHELPHDVRERFNISRQGASLAKYAREQTWLHNKYRVFEGASGFSRRERWRELQRAPPAVEVRPSRLGPKAGLGLFSLQAATEGDWLTTYGGRLVKSNTADAFEMTPNDTAHHFLLRYKPSGRFARYLLYGTTVSRVPKQPLAPGNPRGGGPPPGLGPADGWRPENGAWDLPEQAVRAWRGWDGSSTVAEQEGGATCRPWLGCVHPGSAQFLNDQGSILFDDVWPNGEPGDAKRTPDERLGRAVARYVLGIPRCNAALIQVRPSGVVAVATRDILPDEELLTSYCGSRWWLERLRHALYVQALFCSVDGRALAAAGTLPRQARLQLAERAQECFNLAWELAYACERASKEYLPLERASCGAAGVLPRAAVRPLETVERGPHDQWFAEAEAMRRWLGHPRRRSPKVRLRLIRELGLAERIGVTDEQVQWLYKTRYKLEEA